MSFLVAGDISRPARSRAGEQPWENPTLKQQRSCWKDGEDTPRLLPSPGESEEGWEGGEAASQPEAPPGPGCWLYQQGWTGWGGAWR